MGTVRDFRRLLAFDDWANTQVVEALRPYEAEASRAVAWLAHVMAAQRIWFARVTLTVPPFAVYPDLSLAAVATELRTGHADWARHLDELDDRDLARVVRYQNSSGQAFESTLGDILTHVMFHGQHHRAQCLTALRAAGGVPPAIDFIVAARAGVL